MTVADLCCAAPSWNGAGQWGTALFPPNPSVDRCAVAAGLRTVAFGWNGGGQWNPRLLSPGIPALLS
jgi:hypothetical protein